MLASVSADSYVVLNPAHLIHVTLAVIGNKFLHNTSLFHIFQPKFLFCIMSGLINKPSDFFDRIASLLKQARNSVIRTINHTMVRTYFEVGKLIVEEEQNGKERAEYGKQLIEELSIRLNQEFGKGFSATNLKQMRSFYLMYSKGQTLSDEFELSWSHYLKLMRIDDEKERRFYEIESFKNNWSLRELQRQYDSALYARLALSRDKNKVLELSQKGLVIEHPKDAVKDPYVLEFIGLPEHSVWTCNNILDIFFKQQL